MLTSLDTVNSYSIFEYNKGYEKIVKDMIEDTVKNITILSKVCKYMKTPGLEYYVKCMQIQSRT